jgi:uncharacterized membrane protein YvbJ
MVLFGFGGTVSTMISSLKNNKNLLNGRRSYKEISSQYRSLKQKSNGNRELNQKEINELRETLRKKIISERRGNIFRLIIASIIFILFTIFVISFFNTFF